MAFSAPSPQVVFGALFGGPAIIVFAARNPYEACRPIWERPTMTVFCTKCGAQNVTGSLTCSHCQAGLPSIGYQPTYQAPPDYQSSYEPIQPPAPLYGQPADLDWQRFGDDKEVVARI